MWMRNRWKVHGEFVSGGRSLTAAKLARVRAREVTSSLLNINLLHFGLLTDDPEMQANSVFSTLTHLALFYHIHIYTRPCYDH